MYKVRPLLLLIYICVLGFTTASAENNETLAVATDSLLPSSPRHLQARHHHSNEKPVYTLRINAKPTTTKSNPTKTPAITKSLLPPLCFHITSTSHCWKKTQTKTFTITHSTKTKTSTKTDILPTCTTTTFIAAYHKATTTTTLGRVIATAKPTKNGSHHSASHTSEKHHSNHRSKNGHNRHHSHHTSEDAKASHEKEKSRPQHHRASSSRDTEKTAHNPTSISTPTSTTTGTTNLETYRVVPPDASTAETTMAEPTMSSANNPLDSVNDNDNNNNSNNNYESNNMDNDSNNDNEEGSDKANDNSNNSDVSDPNDDTAPSSTDQETPAVKEEATPSPATASPSNTSTTRTNSNNNNNNNATVNDPNSPGENGVNHRALGIGLGVGIGCVAALGLAGMLVYNTRRKKQLLQQQRFGDAHNPQQQVSTRWRPQSFMNVVASVVAKLPRSPSQRSKASTSSAFNENTGMMTGIAVTTGTDTTTNLPALVSVNEYHR